MTRAFCTSDDSPSIENGPSGLWQQVFAHCVHSSQELCRRLEIPLNAAKEADADYPVLVSEPYLARIPPGEPDHPLLRQILPSVEELQPTPGFTTNPVGDQQAVLGGRLLQKYAGRVLLMATTGCGVHCRFCFRRHFRAEESMSPSEKSWDVEFATIAEDTSIKEIILSGGDPLVLDDDMIEELFQRAAAIPHISRIRIHTRMPIMIPQRITNRLLDIFRKSRLAVFFVAHINHPLEIGPASDDPAMAALQRLVEVGIPVLTQGVLLHRVNDSIDTLAELFQTLVNNRIMPYYLHQLDHVAGAAHFAVSDEQAIEMMQHLRARLPGYAVPRLVREIPGQSGKTVLA